MNSPFTREEQMVAHALRTIAQELVKLNENLEKLRQQQDGRIQPK